MYRFVLFYFVLYICIYVALWSCEARHLVPLYVYTFNQHCSQKQNVTVWLHSALFIKISVSQKRIYVNCSNQFCVVLKCFMHVFYNNKFEVDSHISVFNKICKKKKYYFCMFIALLSYLSSYYGFLTYIAVKLGM